MSEVYDIATMVGSIVLIVLMIYWVMVFGTRITADMLNSAPLTIEDSLASHLTTASIASGDATIIFKLGIPLPLKINLTEKTIFVEPTETHYYPYGEIERGGITLKTPAPLEYIKSDRVKVNEDEDIFDKKYNEEIIVEKTNEELNIETR